MKTNIIPFLTIVTMLGFFGLASCGGGQDELPGTDADSDGDSDDDDDNDDNNDDNNDNDDNDDNDNDNDNNDDDNDTGTEEAQILSEDDECWQNPGCWYECHDEDDTCEDAQGQKPFYCSSCHGLPDETFNGAPEQDPEHNAGYNCVTEECHEAEGLTGYTDKHLPSEDFSDHYTCGICHYVYGK